MTRSLLGLALVSLSVLGAVGCASASMEEGDGSSSAIAVLPNGNTDDVVAKAKTYLAVDFTPTTEIQATAEGIDTWAVGPVFSANGDPVAFVFEGRKGGARVDRIVLFAGTPPSDTSEEHDSVLVGERATTEDELKREIAVLDADLQAAAPSSGGIRAQAFGGAGCGMTATSAALLTVLGLGVAGLVVVCTASTAGLCLGGIAASGGLATTGSVVSVSSLMGAAVNGIAAVSCASE